jgi:hypothetical protein
VTPRVFPAPCSRTERSPPTDPVAEQNLDTQLLEPHHEVGQSDPPGDITITVTCIRGQPAHCTPVKHQPAPNRTPDPHGQHSESAGQPRDNTRQQQHRATATRREAGGRPTLPGDSTPDVSDAGDCADHPGANTDKAESHRPPHRTAESGESTNLSFARADTRALAHVIARVLALAISLLAAQQAWGWGHPGHQLVGSLADELIAGTPAAKQVAAILENDIKDLKTAAPWPDCVRDVERRASGKYVYNAHSKYHSPACVPFEGPQEKARMEDFAERNWDNCPDSASTAQTCHREFHFADVAVQHDIYATKYHGTGNTDIVHAIEAAIGVLRNGPPAKPPFAIHDKKEALMLLTHLVGDLHQPLHVGAIYLDDAGQPVGPDQGASFNPREDTRGGNKLEIGASNLHAAWDDIPGSITLTGLATGPGKKRRQELISQAKAVPATHGKIEDWPVTWATDTVKVSHDALPGLRFSRKGTLEPNDWAVQFSDQTGYTTAREDLQHKQLVKAAAQLAALLKAIWP